MNCINSRISCGSSEGSAGNQISGRYAVFSPSLIAAPKAESQSSENPQWLIKRLAELTNLAMSIHDGLGFFTTSTSPIGRHASPHLMWDSCENCIRMLIPLGSGRSGVFVRLGRRGHGAKGNPSQKEYCQWSDFHHTVIEGQHHHTLSTLGESQAS